MKAKTITALALFVGLTVDQANACSSFFVPVLNDNNEVINVIGARSLDFEDDLPLPVLYGEVGDVNTSSIDVTLAAYNKAATWTNTYQFIGKPASANQLMDGLNTAGVYMAALYLPNITAYPEFQPTALPTLSVFDLINYVLGTSASVEEALVNIQKVQVDMGTIFLTSNFRKVFPLHFQIHDKTGAAAVIEFIGKEMQITTTGNLRVLTNSPDIAFQQQNYEFISQPFVYHNQYYQIDGMFMNGSGLIGLPGDTMSPSRFVRLRTVLEGAPPAHTDVQATYVIEGALFAGAFVPIGENPSPTYWSSFHNFNTGDYKIRNYLTLGDNNLFLVTPPSSPHFEHTYNVFSADHTGQVHAVIQQPSAATVITYDQAAALMAYPTSPTETYVGRFIQ